MVAANLAWIRKAFCDRTYGTTKTGAMKLIKRGLAPDDLIAAVCDDAPEILADYADDARGPACLVLGWLSAERPLHVLVGYGASEDTVIDVITVYEPGPPEWQNPRVRRQG